MIGQISGAFQAVKTYLTPLSWTAARPAPPVNPLVEKVWNAHANAPSLEERNLPPELFLSETDLDQRTAQQPSSDLDLPPLERSSSIKTLLPKTELNKKAAEETSAAITIQRACREYLDHTQSDRLPFSLFEQATSLMAAVDVRSFPRASNGRTPVYFPDSLPDIIFKESGHPQNKIRLKKMIQARRLCQENGYQLLKIPTARISGNFLIEERLPIERVLDQKTQIGLYIEHQECFTEAAIELTSFLCQAKVPDLSGQTKDPWQSLCNTSIPRHDNAVIYLDKEGQGHIGLIDLEDFQQMPNTFNACMQCIRFFPYHFEEILSTAKNFDPKIERHIKTFEKEQRLVLDYFEKVYGAHRAFAESNNIGPEDPLQQLSTLAPEEKNTAAASMMEILDSCLQDLPVIKSFEDIRLIKFLASTSPEQQEAFGLRLPTPDTDFTIPTEALEEIFPELCDMSLELINEQLQIKGQDAELPTSYPQVLSIRTVVFNEKNQLYISLKENFSSKLDSIHFDNESQKEHLLTLAIEASLTTLQKIGKIAYYNPIFGSYNKSYHCIFC
ncbi:MAG: hypothetical protein Q8L98_03375 [Chlamydiales bacterium]|nr:hypothetical protein [Chlamydiales bacterium]